MVDSAEPPVRVVRRATAVELCCDPCCDRRRLPLEPLALRLGVRAFLDEHESCGEVLLSLPETVPAPRPSQPVRERGQQEAGVRRQAG